jgi:hypothetical protein
MKVAKYHHVVSALAGISRHYIFNSARNSILILVIVIITTDDI